MYIIIITEKKDKTFSFQNKKNKIFFKRCYNFFKSELLPLPPKMPLKFAILFFYEKQEILNRFSLFKKIFCLKTKLDVLCQ